MFFSKAERKTRMKKVLNRFAAISLALMLMFTMGINVFAAENVDGTPSDDPVITAMGESVSVEQVIEAINGLSADPRDYTKADVDRIEAIQADFESLSAEDQAVVDSTNHASDGQSCGRVLESAVWTVRSFTTDTSTTLAPGTYTTTTDPAVSSQSDKGKSTSSRTRNWWVESVTVSDDGQATAKIYVTGGAATANKVTSYLSVWSGGNSYEKDSDNCYTIPVDLNGSTYFGGVSSSMPRPIMYALSTTIDEPESPQPGGDTTTYTLDVKNNVSMFSPGETATYTVVGNPDSSNYSRTLTLNMGSNSMTKVRIGNSGEIELGEGNVFANIPVVPGEIQKLQFFSKKKAAWYNRFAVVDLDEKKVTFSDFGAAIVEPLKEASYKGSAITQRIIVKLMGFELKKDVDYTVEYANNVNAGTATVTVKGTGEFDGEKETSFRINKADNTLSVSGKSVKIKKKKVRKKAQKLSAGAVLAISNAKGTVTYKGVGVNKKSKKALKINASNGQVTVKKKTKKGTYKMNVTVTAAGNGNYKAASVTRTITVKVK